ncbi:uncharacterized protein LOC105185701 isoform X2 [Harpegnathos saltator]|uniref:uncharacterized protein LOC105185701 isoform X2 n=1 Tax=Harpegnathos saltator TaxID=610380 RepID=UPI000DBEE245|nr:uncharacterized protein LOC105185701 isoform X2 [Harpegnathos saltator]
MSTRHNNVQWTSLKRILQTIMIPRMRQMVELCVSVWQLSPCSALYLLVLVTITLYVMAYCGIEFHNDDNDNSGEIAIVHVKWLTPRKKNVLWPPYKTISRFNKVLFYGEEPNEHTWQLYNIKRKFFECDDLQKAHAKLKKCETSSDVQSYVSDIEHGRNRKKNRKYFSSSDDENNNSSIEISVLPRPPKIIKEEKAIAKLLPAQHKIFTKQLFLSNFDIVRIMHILSLI